MAEYLNTTKRTAKTDLNSHVTYRMTTCAMFAGIITILTAYVGHIPIGVNGAYIHMGDALIYLAASVLPPPYACLAAAIGGGMADLLTAPVWLPATLLIKPLLCIPFTFKTNRFICRQNAFACITAFFITGIGYYIMEGILYGFQAAAITSIIANAIQSIGSMIVYLLLGTALDRMKFKNRIRFC
ncbi:MAG: TIGR04002 family protein [Blautia sp.]|nr:TIGR04002 family protein [Blautia sp.]